MAKKHPDKYGDGNPPPLPGKTLAQYLDERVRRREMVERQIGMYDGDEIKRRRRALWLGTVLNRDVSSGPLTRSLTQLTR